VIGLINSISKTQKGNFIINVEDPTGSINVMVSSDNPELIELCEDIVLDEVIGIEGALSRKMIYATRIYKPDIPFGSNIKKSPDEVYALFLSDIHVGSNMFLEEDLNRFLKWINQESGNEEQKRVAGLVKYIFILGDIVDGVGIYPGQEKELKIKDIYEQYKKAAEFIKRIPIEKNIFIIPGNHDALRLSEPQPALSRLYAAPFYKMPNVTLLTNPSSIRIHKRANFTGFDILMYHGYSFDYYVANVDTIRKQGGYDRADLIMKFLLHTRHLAPTHTSSLYVPETRDDFLLIKQIPDFFVTGHIHKTSVSNYMGITLISGSCWQARTSFQEKVGHHPEPSRVPIVNLQTREVKILNFSR
jgi:DNA polymerase II small subunit